MEAALLGADAFGFVLSGSGPTVIDPGSARRIVEKLPVFAAKVGLFADEPPIKILEIARSVGLTAVQLCGSEGPGYGGALHPLPWFRAFNLDAEFSPERLGRYECTTFLLRRPPASSVPWTEVRRLGVYGRILIGGGLDETCVAEAITSARPWGVDLGPEIEVAPGKKDIDRLEAVLDEVRRADAAAH